MLAESGNDTFALCLYADGWIDWYYAFVEFRIEPTSANMTTDPFVYTLPGSGSCSILHIASRSNINIPGLYVFLLKHGTEPYFGSYSEQ